MNDQPNFDLSQEQRGKLTAHIRNKAPNLQCPVCTQNKFTVADNLVMGVTVGSGGAVAMGQGIPMALVYCDNCFHSFHFVAGPLNLVEQ